MYKTGYPRYLFYSHNHWDHAKGGQVFKVGDDDDDDGVDNDNDLDDGVKGRGC